MYKNNSKILKNLFIFLKRNNIFGFIKLVKKKKYIYKKKKRKNK